MKRPRLNLLTVALVLALSACGSGDNSSDPAVTDTAATSPEPTPAPVAEPAAAKCSADAVAPVVTAEIDPSGSVPASVDLAECQGGYARAYLVPDDITAYETEQVFLVDRGGEWTILTFGTGIDCANETDFRPAELEDACLALGLR